MCPVKFLLKPLCFVRVHASEPYSSTDYCCSEEVLFSFSSSEHFHITFNLFSSVQAFATRICTSFSVDEMSLPRYTKLNTWFNCIIFCSDYTALVVEALIFRFHSIYIESNTAAAPSSARSIRSAPEDVSENKSQVTCIMNSRSSRYQ